MAVTVSHLAGANGITVFPMVTVSVTPTSEVLIAIQCGDAATVTISGITGCGLTWTQVASVLTDWGSGNYRDFLWKGIGTASAGQITVTFAVNPGTANYIISNVAGHNTAGMIVQSVTATGSSSTAAATLAAFADAGNATFAFVNQNQNDGVTPGTGFTELNEQIRASFTVSSQTQWRADNDTSPDATFATSNPWSIIAVEIAVAAAGGTIYTRTLSDSASITDSPIRGVKAFRQMPQDALAIAELIARGQMHGRTTADSVSISEDIRRAARLFRKENDNATVNDSTLRFVKMFRRLLDDAVVTDSLAVTITLGSTIIVTRVLQDGLDVQDTVMRAVYMYRLESQAIDVFDNSWYSASIVRGLIDTLSVAETAARAMMRGRVVSDSVEAVDLAVRYALLYRLLHDDADASDSLARTITYYETLIGFVLMSLRNAPVALAMDTSLIETSFARAEPILMEMRNI